MKLLPDLLVFLKKGGLSMSKYFLNWYRKQLLLSLLKNRSKNNDVALFFSDRGFIIV